MSAGPELWAAGCAVAACVLTLAGTGIARAFLRRRLLDHPGERSSHSDPTPTGGGLGAVSALLLVLGAAWAAGAAASPDRLALPLGAVLVFAVVGFADDARPMRPRLKLPLLVLGAALALPVATVDVVSVPFAGTVDLGVLAIPLTLFWLAGFANAFNFMDGIDGIAALTTAVTAGLYWFVGAGSGDGELALLAATTTGAALGFLPWNFPRARIFMGDTGSLPFGLLLAVLGALALRPAPGGDAPQLEFPTAVLALGPFVFDTAFTLVRRALRGAPVGEAHREHLYQRLSRRWGGHARVTLLYGALSVGTAIIALGYGARGDAGRLLSLLVPLAAMLAFAGFVLRLDRGGTAGPGSSP